MSTTELYFFGENGDCKYCAEVSNSWRGAMAIWTWLEEKYLPVYRGGVKHARWYQENMSDEDILRLNGFRPTRLIAATDPDDSKEIWALADDERLTTDQKIVLATTFDNCLVKAETIPRVLRAFRAFGGETSLNEQADAIEKAIEEHPEITAVGWNQTSVCADSWDAAGPCDADGNGTAYNWKTGDLHWWLDEEYPDFFREV